VRQFYKKFGPRTLGAIQGDGHHAATQNIGWAVSKSLSPLDLPARHGMIPVSTLMENAAYGASAPTKSAGCTDLRSLQPLAPLTLPAGHTHADISSAIKEVFTDAGLAKKASLELRNVEQHPPNVVAEREAAAGAKAASAAASSETTLATQALDLAATPKSATLVVSVSRDALAVAGDIGTVNTYVAVLTGYESLACT
jgi:hypothetical protein